MTPQEFANLITGREYPFRPTAQEKQTAKENGLVVIWGQSDDLLELDGAVYDEGGAWNGTKARFDAKGILPIYESGELQSDEPTTIQECIELADRWKRSFSVQAEWCPKGTSLSWRISVDEKLSSAMFVVMEDDEPMCEGIVAQLPETS